jgi:Carboxypeptidase regulatory-like domain
MKPFTPVLLTAVLLSPIFISAQQTQPAPPPSPTTPASSGPSNPPTSGTTAKGKEKLLPTFLIVGTVFNEKSLSFPEVEVRIRRRDEKKFRWKTYTNSRGEFAVRVLPGYEYEVAVHEKGYKDQSKTVDSKVDVQQRLSIVLEPVNQPKNGAKP